MRWALKVRAEKRNRRARSGVRACEKSGFPGAIESQWIVQRFARVRTLQILHGGHLAGFDCLQFCSGALFEKNQVTLLLHDGIAPIIAVAQLLLEISLQFAASILS